MIARFGLLGVLLAVAGACGDGAQGDRSADGERPFSGMHPFLEDGKLGFMNSRGEVVIRAQFEPGYDALNTDLFAEQRAAVRVGDRWGYIDETGTLVINPQFDWAGWFREGRAPVVVDGRIGLIDRDGQFLINPQFAGGGLFSEGLAAVQLGDKWGYIDQAGVYVINPQFDHAYEFSESLAQVTQNERRGFIDRTGRFVINPQFDEASEFRQGVSAVRLGGKWGLIDREGKYIINPQFDHISHSGSGGLLLVRIGDRWGYVDMTGKIVINPQFDVAEQFGGAMAFVRSGERVGAIDREGRYVINPQFDAAKSFAEDRAAVRVGDLWGVIDESGSFVVPPRFLDAGERFRDGLLWVETEEGIGYIDRAGAFVREPAPIITVRTLGEMEAAVRAMPGLARLIRGAARANEGEIVRSAVRHWPQATVLTRGNPVVEGTLAPGRRNYYGVMWGLDEPNAAAYVASADFDTYLTVYRVGADGALSQVGANDDYGGTHASMVRLGVHAGVYLVEVRGYSSYGAGSYVLSVGAQDAVEALAAERLAGRRPSAPTSEIPDTRETFVVDTVIMP